jgi:starch synthase
MPTRPLRVAMIAAECEPWAKTGGLADVVDALARALGQVGGAALEAPIDVFLPR